MKRPAYFWKLAHGTGAGACFHTRRRCRHAQRTPGGNGITQLGKERPALISYYMV